jgi:hypothetical protein
MVTNNDDDDVQIIQAESSPLLTHPTTAKTRKRVEKKATKCELNCELTSPTHTLIVSFFHAVESEVITFHSLRSSWF